MGLQHPCPVPGKGQDVPAHTGRCEVTFTGLPACTYAWVAQGRAASRDFHGGKSNS